VVPVSQGPISSAPGAFNIQRVTLGDEYDFTVDANTTLTAAFNASASQAIDTTYNIDLWEAHDMTGFHHVGGANSMNPNFSLASFSLPVEIGHLYALVVTGFIDGAHTPFTVSYTGTLTFGVAATPIPPALLMFGTALVALGGIGRYRRKHPTGSA
jgi:hypothetical protein